MQTIDKKHDFSSSECLFIHSDYEMSVTRRCLSFKRLKILSGGDVRW